MFLIKWFISFISGFVVALPFLIYQLWKFVSPGLLVNEKKYVFPVVFFSLFHSYVEYYLAILLSYHFHLSFLVELDHRIFRIIIQSSIILVF